jgi:hypothetical protein
MMEKQSTQLTRFGRILTAMMADRGVSGLSELAQLSEEAGYEVDEVALRGEMYGDTESKRMHPGNLEGPAYVLRLSTQEQSLLSWAATFGVFASDVGARRFEEFVVQRYG